MGASETFAKLWSSILDSSVWRASNDTKVVWITMLAMAERDGYVGASVGGLAARAGVTVEQCRTALAQFMAPDPDSRTKDHEGRRIAEVDRGWQILNYAKFRDQRDMLAKREVDAERQRRHRERVRASRPVTPVTLGHAESRRVAHADADADADAPRPSEEQGRTEPPAEGAGTREGASAKHKPVLRPPDVSEQVWGDWCRHRKAKRAPVTPTVLRNHRREAERAGIPLEEALAHACSKGWQGFEAAWFLKDRAGGAASGGKTIRDRHAGIDEPGAYTNDRSLVDFFGQKE